MRHDERIETRRSLAAYRARKAVRHRSGILECEARRIARTLARYGVLHEDQLFELAAARSWTPGSFSRARDLAVELGLIRRLGLGFYAAPRTRERSPSAGEGQPMARRALRSLRSRAR